LAWLHQNPDIQGNRIASFSMSPDQPRQEQALPISISMAKPKKFPFAFAMVHNLSQEILKLEQKLDFILFLFQTNKNKVWLIFTSWCIEIFCYKKIKRVAIGYHKLQFNFFIFITY
jgi:hypothetical protein